MAPDNPNTSDNRLGNINWGQAFVEVTLILVGVGIALLADNWITYRSERDEERQYLTALSRDLEDTKSELVRTLRLTEESREQTLRFIHILQGSNDVLEEQELINHLQNPFTIHKPSGVFGTYHDMVNSGDLRLIRNSEVRTAMAKFESDWNSKLWTVIQEGFDQWNQIQVPFFISNQNVTSAQLQGNSDFPMPDGFVFEPIDRDSVWTQDFENVLAVSILNDNDQTYQTNELISQAESILALIDNELTE